MFSINAQENSPKKSHKAESFLKGTFILTVASLVVKVIGSLNWIFVSRVLGGEGIGLYQMAFPIYFLALTVSSAGVPVAISIITAERVALKDILGARRISAYPCASCSAQDCFSVFSLILVLNG